MGPFSPLSRGSVNKDSARVNTVVENAEFKITKGGANATEDSSACRVPAILTKGKNKNNQPGPLITPNEAYQNNFYATQSGATYYSQGVSHR